MALKVHHDGSAPNEVQENCCMCHCPTRMWHKSDVALCELCAQVTSLKDLPTKAQWGASHKSRELLRKMYLPKNVHLGERLTISVLQAIVEYTHPLQARRLQLGLQRVDNAATHAQVMMQTELRELMKLITSDATQCFVIIYTSNDIMLKPYQFLASRVHGAKPVGKIHNSTLEWVHDINTAMQFSSEMEAENFGKGNLIFSGGDEWFVVKNKKFLSQE